MSETNTTAPAHVAYIGSYTRPAEGGSGNDADGISVYAVDPASGALTLRQVAPQANPSWVALDPGQRFLYAATETDDYEGEHSGGMAAYAVNPADGTLTYINEQSSGGAHPCHQSVDPSGRFLVAANYNGPFVVFPIRPDGGLDPVCFVWQNEGTGPDEARQEMSHPHCALFTPDGRFLATADLGVDAVQIFRLDDDGTLNQESMALLAEGSGPRHLVFSPDGTVLYVANELNATITALAFDPETGDLGEEIQTISMVPDDFTDERSAAEIALHPSGRFLYASNREVSPSQSPLASSIVAYAVDEEAGDLTLLGHTFEGLDVPRGFAIDPTGTWLYVASQNGHDLRQYAIDAETGALTPTGEVLQTPSPVSVLFSA
ncbi:MAG: lactonase family protein [Thermomicrobiales bacterium]|nr:lactonase family protein [Thermomicrobiales bacterium]